MNRLMCDLTYCIHNNACCSKPANSRKEESYCKIATRAEEVDYKGYNGCKGFKWDNDKKCMCIDCQIEETGKVDMRFLDQKTLLNSAKVDDVEDVDEF